MFKLVVFDLDGTLINSVEGIMRSINITFAGIGLGPYEWERDIVRFFGKTLEKWVETLLKEGGKYSEENVEKVANDIWETYSKVGKKHNKLYDGVKDVLEELRKRGIKMAIATNMRSKHANIFLPLFGIDKYFEKVCTSTNTKRGKPFPDQMDSILEKVKVDKSDALVVGDSRSDLEFARNSGVKVALVEMPWNRDLKSDYRVKKLRGILDIV
jgi:phosphoglycolate phosphatase